MVDQILNSINGCNSVANLQKMTFYNPNVDLVKAAPVAERVRSLYFSALNHLIISPVSGVGSSPALATRETSQVLLPGVSGGFPGVLPFSPTFPLTRLYK